MDRLIRNRADGPRRFNLNGDPAVLPAKLAVSLALIFHELATNAGKTGAFVCSRPVAGVVDGVENAFNVNGMKRKVPWSKMSQAAIGTNCCQSALARSTARQRSASYASVNLQDQCRLRE